MRILLSETRARECVVIPLSRAFTDDDYKRIRRYLRDPGRGALVQVDNFARLLDVQSGRYDLGFTSPSALPHEYASGFATCIPICATTLSPCAPMGK